MAHGETGIKRFDRLFLELKIQLWHLFLGFKLPYKIFKNLSFSHLNFKEYVLV